MPCVDELERTEVMLLDYFWKRAAIRAGGGNILTNGESRPNVNEIVKRGMKALYEEITTPKIKKKAAKIVRPFVEAGIKPTTIPVTSSIDWAKMERDSERVSALLKLWQEQADDLEDEEMLLMLMAA